MFFLADNTAGKESRTQNSHDPATKLTPEEERSAYDNMAATFYYYTYNDGRFGPENAGHPSFDDHVIRLETRGENIKGWYYGNTDDCITGRENYYPGFFVCPMEQLEIKGGRIRFRISYENITFLNKPLPVDYKSNEDALRGGRFEKWIHNGAALNRKHVIYTGRYRGIEVLLDSNKVTYGKRRFVRISESELHDKIKSMDYSFVRDNTQGNLRPQ